ncbi:IclR family transcriptional regulator [Ottowia thiooxydans]|uniref:IclR family transcriptional regulator n=1 Tax=Ottowia thiooxydans TaxID=219182 RepID=UPI00041B96B9|nr:IclR family transcriptional regulator [Ottowia thiooxydans]
MAGTQSFERAVLLLRLVAHQHREGARLAELTRAAGLTQPTVHRIVMGLVAEGLVSQHPQTRRYHLGQMVADLGLTAAMSYDSLDLYRACVARLASDSEDTAFMSKRSGLDMICVERRAGAHPAKAFVLDVGVRRPLGVGASGMAVLSTLDPQEAPRVLEANAGAIAQFESLTLKEISALMPVHAREGYVLRDHDDTDVRTIAVPVRGVQGTGVATFSISTFRARMPMERVPEIVRMLKREAAWVENLERNGSP